MRTNALPGAIVGGIIAAVLCAAPAHAQATRTWVSGVGDDVNPCSRTAPCKTFAGAISKTAVNGEINCLDPGGFGGVTITKSITIDCHEVYGSVLVAGTNGISIPFDSFAGTDTRKTVRLRNINFNGADTGLRGISITGASNSANSEVFVEDCMIDGFFGSPGNGISDTRANGGKLFVANTTIRNVLGSGVFVFPSSGSTRIDASISGVRVGNVNGAAVSFSNGVKAMVVNSVFSANTTGIDAEGTGVEVTANQVTLNGNATAFFVGAGNTVRLANSDASFNVTLVNAGGAVNSFTNNRFVSNGAGTITQIAPANTNPSGQQ
jgi:hypothetical protein